MRGDPDVDRVAADFCGAHPELGPSQLWVGAALEVAGAPEASDELIDRYLREPAAWPEWVDHERLAAGQRFFAEHLEVLHLAFLLGSLPRSYTAADGALVLVRAGRLEGATRRRVFETAPLVTELAIEDNLHEGRAGHLALRRLRLLHAVVRHVLLAHAADARTDTGEGEPWSVASHGVPVSQLDQLGTLLLFSVGSLEVLERNGVPVDGEAAEGWVHLWCLAGHLLGVADDPDRPPLLPMGLDEAQATLAAVEARQCRGSAPGRVLVGELIELGADLAAGPRRIRPRHRRLVSTAMAANLGAERAGQLGLAAPPAPDPRLERWNRRLRFGLRTLRRSPPSLTRLRRRLGPRLLRWLTNRLAEAGGPPAGLRRPTDHAELLARYRVAAAAAERRRR